MKKIYLLSLFILYNIANAQSNKIIVEIDNSQKYLYESTYYKLKSDASKKRIADRLTMFSEKLITQLQDNANYLLANGADYDRVNREVSRLKNYAVDILGLLPMLEANKLTGDIMTNTVNRAYDEYNLSSEKGELIVMYEETIIRKGLNDFIDTNLYNVAVSRTGKSIEQLKIEYFKYGAKLSFVDYLKNILTPILAKEYLEEHYLKNK